MDSFPKFLTRYDDEETGQSWFNCRQCGHESTPRFSDINMRMEAREHARTCPAKERVQHAVGS